MPEQNLENIAPVESPQPNPENISNPEKKQEQKAEQAGESSVQKEQEQAQAQAAQAALASDQANTKPIVQSQEIVLQKVESILAENMDRVFLTMDVAAQAKFKAKGEETARQIASLLSKTKVKTKEVLKLILNWLRVIPGVNKFYIEQEAKIKADRILKIHEGKE
ncbi:hypothetical protein C0580_01140 [Candidatus Parcubacteria bacterium]|nr:MAG: hypothetical protein C0580_01140 [Candidatus Parcubacteria bacterium]